MNSQDNASHLSTDLRNRVLEQLGFSIEPSADLAGPHALYETWCEHVPFDPNSLERQPR
jgi:hypothetical protein